MWHNLLYLVMSLEIMSGTYTVTAQAYSEPLAQGRESAIFTMAFAIFPELDDDIGDCPPGEGKCLECQGDCDVRLLTAKLQWLSCLPAQADTFCCSF